MMETNRRPKQWVATLVWIVASFLIFVLAFFDPFDLHPLDGWLQARLGYSVERLETEGESESQGQLWTCSMHSHVLQDHPGECPICGMDLVPVDVARSNPASSSTDQDQGSSGKREILFYRNPMNPLVTSPVPAKDEMGMDYVPVYAESVLGAGGESATVHIDPVVVQNMNIQSEPVERRDLSHEIRTVGYLAYDQGRMVTVTTKYEGWVEKVYVNYVGEPVRRGQPLFEIYAPELLQTEQELLSAIEYAKKFENAQPEARRRANALVEAAKTRLGYWDVSPRQIAALEETGEVVRTLTVVSPASGLVMKRIAGLEGMAVKPGMEMYHIADLSSLWLSVEIFEDQVAWVQEGTPAEFEFTYFPGETFHGKIRFIEPEFDETSRTLRVKLEVPNPEGRLRSGMFATVVFQPVAAPAALTVPSLAVLRSGQRNVVVVDLGDGRFAPRDVRLGHEGQGYSEVLEGLDEGDRVVTSAQFLIDSEASLQSAIQQMLAQRQGPAEPAEETRDAQ
jgi:Cu(I)/Ag(I) efflux system membrane fusion protein/cobalt-zinc-cadmium efflux system membrane fusion protein